eukprot:TRINITY_DN13373_c0_g1_i1.p1 TRINITY_DN13373_c0_g1~~TRINITY_DN13373_c0_g1_i1.p1  ORF type:complete len:125 (-),score=0.78 TRINITY_DN13373_c0_g1_i1:41-415(-)
MRGMGFVDFLNQAIRDADAASTHRNRSWRKVNFLTMIRFTLNNMYVIHHHDSPKERRETFGDFLDRCATAFTAHAESIAERKQEERRAKKNRQYRESKRRSRERQAETKSRLNQMSINFLLNNH